MITDCDQVCSKDSKLGSLEAGKLIGKIRRAEDMKMKRWEGEKIRRSEDRKIRRSEDQQVGSKDNLKPLR